MQISEASIGKPAGATEGFEFVKIGDIVKNFPNFVSKDTTERFFKW